MSALALPTAPALRIEFLATSWRPWALLIGLCACLFVPGIAAMPPLDRDEARFMQATRQMVESGDLLQIRFQDEARNKKPAGIYWLQSASVALFSTPASTEAWPYRLPSLLGATLSVLLTFAFGARLVGRPAALLGAALLASSLLLVVEAHLAKTDAVLLATVVAAQGALGVLYRGAHDDVVGHRGLAVVFWLAQGIGILIKGPVTPLISLLTISALCLADRRWRWLGGLRPLWGVPVAVAVAAPWFFAIQAATGGAFANEALGHDLIGKIVGAQESHGAPPGAYLLLAPVTLWPVSALLGIAGVAGWRERRNPAARFLLAWIIPAWLLFELVPTKLPHYLLPVYPALTLLAGNALAAIVAGAEVVRRKWLDSILFALWAIVGLALVIALIGLPILWGEGVAALSLVPAAATISFGLVMLRQLWSGFSLSVVLVIAALAILVFAPSFATLLPGLNALWLSRSAAALVAQLQPPAGIVVDTVGYNEPSLVFLLRGATRAVGAAEAAADVASRQGALALVAARDDAAFRAALAARGVQPVRLGKTTGIDYSRSAAPTTLGLYGAAAP
jgi:4-amino-4-deoxy-L-arabinose transferase-like glycosyltransferase